MNTQFAFVVLLGAALLATNGVSPAMGQDDRKVPDGYDSYEEYERDLRMQEEQLIADRRYEALAKKKARAQQSGSYKQSGTYSEGDGDSDSPTIQRSNSPPDAPDATELNALPVNGRVRFSFTGQPWPAVLQWLANVSDLSLDWQETPGDYLNLTTQRDYTLAEARDLINRHLEARGFTLLLDGEVLSVVRIEKLDPSLIPRITEEELYDRQPHDFVKVTFLLPPGLDVEQTTDDIRHALSEHAKLVPLASTNRLLLIDTVANLRLVSAILNEERLEQAGRVLPQRFKLRYVRADQVIEKLYQVLGTKSPVSQAQQQSQSQTQMSRDQREVLEDMRIRMESMMNQQNKKKKKEDSINLAYNRNDNSILANAPPAALKIIARTIELLDIPPPGINHATQANPGTRFAKTYQLESIEPNSLIRSLQQVGDLHPLTDLRGDEKSKVLFARASADDHQRIEAIIGQLDGRKYRVEVFWLRQHPADEVAGTIAALVGGDLSDSDGRASQWQPWFRRRRNNSQQRKEPTDTGKLRVEADIENNRLFVRGNDAQIAEVRAFLVQIGELPGDGQQGGGGGSVQAFDAIGPDEMDRLLERLRAAWPAIGGGVELKIDDARKRTPVEPEASTPAAKPNPTPEPTGVRTTNAERTSRFRLVADAPRPLAAAQVAAPPAPAAITITEDGRLVASSNDPALLRRLVDLVETLRPAEETFTEFRLEHVSARYVTAKLEDYYEEILSSGYEDRINAWGDFQGRKLKKTPNRLSNRRQLRMIYNVVTNSIVVTNATQAQLTEIGRLIESWDQPPMRETILQRRTGMVKIRYSKAKTIATALKEVYRDLLSARDKEFDSDESKGTGFATAQLTQIEYGGARPKTTSDNESTRKTKAIETTFDGALSIGVDEIANMLVISADAELYESVVDMVSKLDEQARPNTTVEVVRVGVSAEALRKALGEVISTPWSKDKPRQSRSGKSTANDQQEDREEEQQRRERGSASR